MLPTHDVPCPHCGKPLYSASSLEDGVNAAAAESPAVKRDGAGECMTCPHCGSRVAMESTRRGDAAEVHVWKERPS